VGGRWWARPLLLLVIVAAGAVAVAAVGFPSPAEIRTWVDGAGWVAPVVFAVVLAALTLTPAPATVSSILAGAVFGVPVGLAVVLSGALTGAATGFALARWLGRDAFRRIDSRRVQQLDTVLQRRGLVAVVGIRLVPMLPFAALNYACGLSGVRARDYLLGTGIGILPGAAAYVMLGASGTTPGPLSFGLAAAGLLALLLLVAFAVGRWRRDLGTPRVDAADQAGWPAVRSSNG
jgi:uncharacterized membrane protein YdjX (TVP38/TMEM64 family)